MKTVIAYTLAVATSLGAVAHAAELDVTVAGLRSAQGSVGLSLVDSAAAWDGKAKPVKQDTLPAQDGKVVFRLTGLAPGAYAASVIHDENANGKFDTNFMGMPTEGYGFSNDPQVMRKATFEEARFTLGADGGAITIHLR